MPAFTIIDPVARSLSKFPLGAEIVLSLFREAKWIADKTITDIPDRGKEIELNRDYNMIGMNLYYPMQYLNIVPILQKLGIPPRWEDRGKRSPIIIAGGASVTMSPFPVTDFFDFILLGDAEGVLPEILKLRNRTAKDYFLRRVSKDFPCVFVPKYPQESYTVNFTSDIHRGLLPPAEGRQPKIELSRGCKFQCSFCLQAVIPYRENRFDSLAKCLGQYSGRSVLLGSNAPCSYNGIGALLDFCLENKIYSRGFSFRLSALNEAILKKMKALKMVSANVGIEGYSERLRKMVRKGYRTSGVISLLCLIQRYIPMITLDFISHLPTVNVADVLQFQETLEAILQQRDKEGLNVGYDLTVTPLVPRPHTELELVPYREENAERVAHEIRMAIIEKYGGIGAKFSLSDKRRKMEMLLTRGDASFGNHFIRLHEKYPTFYFHQSFNAKIFDHFSAFCGKSAAKGSNMESEYWLGSGLNPVRYNRLSHGVNPHWNCISYDLCKN